MVQKILGKSDIFKYTKEEKKEKKTRVAIGAPAYRRIVVTRRDVDAFRATMHCTKYFV